MHLSLLPLSSHTRSLDTKSANDYIVAAVCAALFVFLFLSLITLSTFSFGEWWPELLLRLHAGSYLYKTQHYFAGPLFPYLLYQLPFANATDSEKVFGIIQSLTYSLSVLLISIQPLYLFRNSPNSFFHIPPSDSSPNVLAGFPPKIIYFLVCILAALSPLAPFVRPDDYHLLSLISISFNLFLLLNLQKRQGLVSRSFLLYLSAICVVAYIFNRPHEGIVVFIVTTISIALSLQYTYSPTKFNPKIILISVSCYSILVIFLCLILYFIISRSHVFDLYNFASSFIDNAEAKIPKNQSIVGQIQHYLSNQALALEQVLGKILRSIIFLIYIYYSLYACVTVSRSRPVTYLLRKPINLITFLAIAIVYIFLLSAYDSFKYNTLLHIVSISGIAFCLLGGPSRLYSLPLASNLVTPFIFSSVLLSLLRLSHWFTLDLRSYLLGLTSLFFLGSLFLSLFSILSAFGNIYPSSHSSAELIKKLPTLSIPLFALSGYQMSQILSGGGVAGYTTLPLLLPFAYIWAAFICSDVYVFSIGEIRQKLANRFVYSFLHFLLYSTSLYFVCAAIFFVYDRAAMPHLWWGIKEDPLWTRKLRLSSQHTLRQGPPSFISFPSIYFENESFTADSTSVCNKLTSISNDYFYRKQLSVISYPMPTVPRLCGIVDQSYLIPRYQYWYDTTSDLSYQTLLNYLRLYPPDVLLISEIDGVEIAHRIFGGSSDKPQPFDRFRVHLGEFISTYYVKVGHQRVESISGSILFYVLKSVSTDI